ncbi:TPM domain-containing protein [Sphingomonas sp. MG17]|uniref:TPM domain-containing protein n=1 Tax=Sphingomonas tagetis TaxID=2949092 RepID=A0A9X2HI53_9SPHN|nr:TPM domain-containing protein [Sphingomonas tagetis]MCP3731626.1 TPM domain-containing protein [Sphingomonas tagetis]
MLAAGVALAACGGQAEPKRESPVSPGRVVDRANLLTVAEEARLERALARSERRTRAQFVVATVPDLKGKSIVDFGVDLGRELGVGRYDIDDGVMLIVAPTERQVRIEVGYGLEGILRDVEAKAIIDGKIMPRFRRGDMGGGILAGSAVIMREIDVPGATP